MPGGFALPRYGQRYYADVSMGRDVGTTDWTAVFSSESALTVDWPSGIVVTVAGQVGLSLIGIPGLRPAGG
jgi:hypothetical protein